MYQTFQSRDKIPESESTAPGTDSFWQTWNVSTVQRLHHRQTRSHGVEGWKDSSEDNKWMIAQCAAFSKGLNPRNIDKSVSDIRILIRFPFENSFWISLSGCKLAILPDIQPANRIVINSAGYVHQRLRDFVNMTLTRGLKSVTLFTLQCYHVRVGLGIP